MGPNAFVQHVFTGMDQDMITHRRAPIGTPTLFAIGVPARDLPFSIKSDPE
jgi:hypothetical protein